MTNESENEPVRDPALRSLLARRKLHAVIAAFRDIADGLRQNPQHFPSVAELCQKHGIAPVARYIVPTSQEKREGDGKARDCGPIQNQTKPDDSADALKIAIDSLLP